jgi:hypothetical protein
MADIFPTIEDSEEAEFFDASLEEDTLNEVAEPSLPYGFSWAFDFTAGDILLDRRGNTRVVSERRTLHEWIGHTLSTERYETPIYGGDIGTIINRLIGAEVASDPHTMAVVEEEITEAIKVHDRVASIDKIALIPLDYEIFVYMRLQTDDGSEFQEVVRL